MLRAMVMLAPFLSVSISPSFKKQSLILTIFPLSLAHNPQMSASSAANHFKRFHDAGSLPCLPVCKITGAERNCFSYRFRFFTILKRRDILNRGRKLAQACPRSLRELAAEHGSQLISRGPIVIAEH